MSLKLTRAGRVRVVSCPSRIGHRRLQASTHRGGAILGVVVSDDLEQGEEFVDKTFLEPAAGDGNFLVAILQDFSSGSDIDWTRPVPEIDRQLYTKYGLTEAEIAFIEAHVKPME